MLFQELGLIQGFEKDLLEVRKIFFGNFEIIDKRVLEKCFVGNVFASVVFINIRNVRRIENRFPVTFDFIFGARRTDDATR